MMHLVYGNLPTQSCWNLIKDSLAPSISPGHYGWTGRGEPSNMVSEPGDLEFEPRVHIFQLFVILPTEVYGGAHVAQTSGPLSGAAGP
jgi:hypothetical protein